jgi:hypothetical protein
MTFVTEPPTVVCVLCLTFRPKSGSEPKDKLCTEPLNTFQRLARGSKYVATMEQFDFRGGNDVLSHLRNLPPLFGASLTYLVNM